jgi:hypothetical protein
MADCAIARIEDECEATFSQWTGAFATDPMVGTETEDISELDMGTVAAAANTDAKAVSVEFPTDFDDTVQDGVRIWAYNIPGFTGHTWAAEFDDGATFPAVSLDAVLAGASAGTLTGRPFSVTATHINDIADCYDSANNRIHTIIIQLQLAAGAKVWNQTLSIHSCPHLVVQYPRRVYGDYGNSESLLQTDEETGHFMQISDANLFVADTDNLWQEIGTLKTDTLTYTKGQTYADWSTGVPSTIVHRAISGKQASFSFQIDGSSVGFRALASHTTASRNSTDRVVRWSHKGCTASVKERQFAIMCRTHGGYYHWLEIPRGVLTQEGDTSPATTEWAGTSFMVESLASGVQKTVLTESITDTPVGMAVLPMTYITTA